MNRVWPPAGDPPLVPPRQAPRPPWIVWAGLAVVLAAAAVLSFDELRNLALAVSISDKLAWLLPVAVDAGAAVSCATWLGGRTGAHPARYAGRMTLALLAVTVLGNAGQLGMVANHISPPWWVAVLVGAIPPAIVGATVHLLVLLVRTDQGSVEAGEKGPPASSDAADLEARTPDAPAGPQDRVDVPEPAPTDPIDQTTRTPSGELTPAVRTPRTADPDPDEDDLDDQALVEKLGEWASREGAVPSRERVRIEFGIGSRRAGRIREAVLPDPDRMEVSA